MTAEAYAQALWQTIQRGTAPKKAVASLHTVLVKHGRTALLPRIARVFARIAEREARRTDITLSVAREKDARTAKQSVKRLVSELGVQAADVQTAVDEHLIGGWRLEGRGTLVDASYQRHLLSLYENVVRS